MNHQPQRMTCAQAIQIDIVAYLSKAGYQPVKIRNNNYWFLSPLRIEKTPSFLVNRILNRWYDHGIGKGGNLIDLAILLNNCTIAELLHNLETNFSFHSPDLNTIPISCKSSNDAIKIIEVKSLRSPGLLQYLNSRCIPISIAKKYCKEIQFELSDKPYYSIGFLNDKGGYELPNAYCKNSSSPKGITTLKNSSKQVAVFEGFFDFLSFLILFQKEPAVHFDFCILNSLSFFEKSLTSLDNYEAIHLFLNNDTAGQKCSSLASNLSKKYIDESGLYKNYKDLNEWLILMGKLPAQPTFQLPPINISQKESPSSEIKQCFKFLESEGFKLK